MKRIQSSAFRLEYANLTEPHLVMRYGEVIGVYYPGDPGLLAVPQEQVQSVREETPAPAPAFAIPPRATEPTTLDTYAQFRPAQNPVKRT